MPPAAGTQGRMRGKNTQPEQQVWAGLGVLAAGQQTHLQEMLGSRDVAAQVKNLARTDGAAMQHCLVHSPAAQGRQRWQRSGATKLQWP